MTFEQLADAVTLKLGFNTQDRSIQPNLVAFLGDKIRGIAIPEYVKQYGKGSLSLFCKSTTLPVQRDRDRNRKYIEPQFSILGGMNNAGFIQVSKTAEDEGSFVGMAAGMLSTYSKLEAGGAAGQTIYWPEGRRIYFKNIDPTVTEVLLKAVPSLFNVLDDNEHIPQPLEFDAILVDGCTQELQERKLTPEDKAASDAVAPTPNTQQ